MATGPFETLPAALLEELIPEVFKNQLLTTLSKKTRTQHPTTIMEIETLGDN